MITRRAVIRGRVQGVGYRAWVMREAKARHLTGWVRNLADGSVEALFAGDDAAVSAMMVACRAGPRLCAVRDVEAMPTGEDVGPEFVVRPDA